MHHTELRDFHRNIQKLLDSTKGEQNVSIMQTNILCFAADKVISQ